MHQQAPGGKEIFMRKGLHAFTALVLVSTSAACASDDDVDTVGPEAPEVVAEAKFFADPAAYVDERVTVLGEMDTILHNDAFTMVPQIDATGQETGGKLLVVHPGDLDVAVGSPIEVTGTTRRAFDRVPPFGERFVGDPAFDPLVGEPYLEADELDQAPEVEGTDPTDAR